MKQINSKQKAQSALMGVAFMLLFALVCCKQTGGGGKPTPTPTKYTVTLNQVEYGNKVTASPAIPADKKVLKDTVITFTAKAKDGYKIGKWKVTPAEALQAGTGANGSPTAKVKITADTQVSVNFELIPKQAVLTLDPNKLTIDIGAKTADGKPIEVEGCNETTLKSDMTNITELHATGTRVVLKGDIIVLDFNGSYNNKQPLTAIDVSGLTHLQKLYCSYNQLTALNVQGLTSLWRLDCSENKLTELNVQGLTALKELSCSDNKLTELKVQGCTSLQELNCRFNKLTALNVQGLTALKNLECYANKFNAQAMTELLQVLPAREVSDGAVAVLYIEITGFPEGNCKDFTQPAELKTAFDGAKSRNWKLQKVNASRDWVDI